jgi:hypothetical protein
MSATWSVGWPDSRRCASSHHICFCLQAPHSGRAGSRAEEQDAQVQEVAGGGNTGGELAFWRFMYFRMVVKMTYTSHDNMPVPIRKRHNCRYLDYSDI